MPDILYNNDRHYIPIMMRSKETDGEWSYWDYLGRHGEIERRIKMEDRCKHRNWCTENHSACITCEHNKANYESLRSYYKPIENPKAQLLEDMLRDLHVYFVPDKTEQITIEITRGNVRVKKSVQEDLAVTI